METEKDEKPLPVVRPGDLVIVKHGNNRMLARALRLYDKEDYIGGRWGGTNSTEMVPQVEVLELINITDLANTRAYEGGNFVYTYRLRDVKLYDSQEAEDLFADLATRLRRIREQVRLYQTTTDCDPNFQVPKWNVESFAEERAREEKRRLNTSELLLALYGDCYKNAHQKGKIV